MTKPTTNVACTVVETNLALSTVYDYVARLWLCYRAREDRFAHSSAFAFVTANVCAVLYTTRA